MKNQHFITKDSLVRPINQLFTKENKTLVISKKHFVNANGIIAESQQSYLEAKLERN